jgi:acyl-CoA thioester hydrolase
MLDCTNILNREKKQLSMSENTFVMPLQFRWSDIDFMSHVRHTVYYDLGAQMRTEMTERAGIGLAFMAKKQVGPVLFHEQCKFKREIRYGTPVDLHMVVIGMKSDFSQFKIRHHFVGKNDVLHAELEVHGAFIDMRARKVSAPPEELSAIFDTFPKAADFAWF